MQVWILEHFFETLQGNHVKKLDCLKEEMHVWILEHFLETLQRIHVKNYIV